MPRIPLRNKEDRRGKSKNPGSLSEKKRWREQLPSTEKERGTNPGEKAKEECEPLIKKEG